MDCVLQGLPVACYLDDILFAALLKVSTIWYWSKYYRDCKRVEFICVKKSVCLDNSRLNTWGIVLML